MSSRYCSGWMGDVTGRGQRSRRRSGSTEDKTLIYPRKAQRSRRRTWRAKVILKSRD